MAAGDGGNGRRWRNGRREDGMADSLGLVSEAPCS